MNGAPGAWWDGVSRGAEAPCSRWPVMPGLKSGPISEAKAKAEDSYSPFPFSSDILEGISVLWNIPDEITSCFLIRVPALLARS